MSFDPVFVWIAVKAGLSAIPVTAGLSLAGFGISLIFGTLIAVIRVYAPPFFASFLKVYIDILKAIPAILILYILYFTLTDGYHILAAFLRFKSAVISVNVIAICALSFTGSVTVSETIRGSFMSVNQGQYEAAYSVGLTFWQTLGRIILPQVIPVAAPMLCNNLIFFIQSSSLMYFISVMDILNASLMSASANYRFLEAYTGAAVIYWVICAAVARLSKTLELRLSHFRRSGV
jgi:L-cystine transport system permease protein